MKIGIIGTGEVGSAIAKFYPKKDVLFRNLEVNELVRGLDVLHVCVPHYDKFGAMVEGNITAYQPKLVIIHSTVPVGTTRALSEQYKYVVHSPVRGVHPKLYQGIKKFVKYIGADSKEAGQKALKHYQKIGIKGKVIKGSANTEAGKILDTTAYGWSILFEKFVYLYCEENNLDFEVVYKDFTETYNQGYAALGRKEVMRPVLKHVHGPIGGHCVVPNCKLISFFPAELIGQLNNNF